MHLNEMARELQITTQELRRELAKTNFGISPGAHEIDDNLSMGIIRFLKGKIKPTLKNRRVTVIMKDGSVSKKKGEGEEEAKEKEEKKETKKPPRRAMTKKEKEALEAEKRRETAEKEKKEETEEKKVDRSYVPKNAPRAVSDGGKALHVSRRIEIGTVEKQEVGGGGLPRTYYKSKKKKRGKHASQELGDDLEIISRHPGRKIKIAKVSYQEELADELSAEEIEIMKEQDREHFRAQKKNRASSQKRGPKEQPQIKAKIGVVEVPAIISLKEFAEKAGLSVTAVIATLLKNGMMATINQQLDFDTAAIVADELGVEIKKKEEEANVKDLFEGDLSKLLQDEKKNLVTRPPIISIMGHVDHGKTKLLDYIRKSNVVAGEAGGITQHIGAYQVEKNGHLITFLDTPGHEAFTSMRARGAKATDIAILVVAADEGVKPQTVEAINHAKEAGIPIIVAINKIDKPNANPEKVKGELVEYGLQSEDWGGKNIMVPVSAHTGKGIDTLLEMILLVAEMEDLQANPNRPAVGTVVESHLDKALGPVATILVNTGTLRVGDSVVVGTSIGKIKAMHDHKGRNLVLAPPSAAARISGLSKVPQAGDILQSFTSDKIAKEKAQKLIQMNAVREERMSGSMVERLVSGISSGEINFLKIVLKADTKGSLEAIMQSLQKIKGFDVAIKVIHFGVGSFADTDVIMASASQALLVGFHVKASSHVMKLAEKEGVDIKSYDIIYKLIEDMKAILSGMLTPEINVVELGKLEIKEIFLNKKKWVIAGARVTDGRVEANAMARVMHDGETLFETRLESLKHVKQDVSELEKGSDCGIKIATPKPVEPGDVLEVFKVEKIERHLD
ncbi:translation initiation factor IF-2 [Patescibacteria group bacterium]|nr:translation initiation factor IF-2 [Patescibacteria group bacterium]MBU1015840.1 translation initiation factor IF-2 [Patescibacteria group bacterium]MBU1685286.1 translation initiation factor IF-2 [Patescibacteria group bacterium]MBU1938483.1 translation initiation factor IF-2 [Patescibacteria group bacterium]